MAQAFEELIGSFMDDLYSAAICFTLDEHLAEELLQEASIRAFHEFPRVQRRADLRHLMLALLVSTYLQRRRRQGHDPLAPDSGLYGEVEGTVPQQQVGQFPEHGTPRYRLLLNWAGHFWSQLDDGDRLVLWLADVERLRHRRVAEMTGLGVEEVRARHYRARRALGQGAARELGRRAYGGVEA
ncbi:MAG: hypothetical protein JSV86_04210 [Gemmatimonadota bacterium]|nr:MAG: hypothetical protein JSV86_04210 [Gemmatimonadota bacterium]